MNRAFQCVIAAAFALSSLSSLPWLRADDGVAFFESNVRALLVKRCYECHGAEKNKGGLALDTRAGWQKGGESGAAIVPGKPEESLLIKAVRYEEPDLAMPPRKKGGKLSEADIALLTEWVKMGAPDPREAEAKLGGMKADEAKSWWAFQALPKAEPAGRPSKIDAFISATLAAQSLPPNPPADQRALIRRATYDLTGLPPTPEEVDAFVADRSPDAFVKVIERLLASPQYGVQWGRHWLDVARYADTAGENTDRPLPHAWRYRNWVFDAFNRDLPYDQFVRLQLAGDILEGEKPQRERNEGVIATGYLAIARRFGHDIDQDIHLMREDVIDNLGKNFLGLSIGCARCHDHKYDPITAQDYYALYGIFSSTRFAFPGCEAKGQPRDMAPLIPQAQVDALLKPWRERNAKAEAEKKRRAESVGAAKKDHIAAPDHGPALVAMGKTLLAKSMEAEPAPAIPVAYAVAEATPKNARLQERGEPDKPGEEVPRRWLSVFGGERVPEGGGSGRRQLGDWIARQPLAARVMVNRIWQWHFGSGLVRSPNDFGARGERPTHPELLDWLASQFIASGYSVKAMHRLIMSTDAYQRSSARPDAAVSVDPDNRLLARFDRRRLAAEEIRDSLLSVSGQLDVTPSEAHPFPPEETWKFTQHNPFNAVYPTNKRSAYLMVQRQRRHPFLALFDGADPNASTPARQTTTIPSQALYFLNDPFFHAQAAQCAESWMNLPDDTARVAQAFRTFFQREPSAAEREQALQFIAKYPAAPAEKWSAYARVLLAGNEFIHLD